MYHVRNTLIYTLVLFTVLFYPANAAAQGTGTTHQLPNLLNQFVRTVVKTSGLSRYSSSGPLSTGTCATSNGNGYIALYPASMSGLNATINGVVIVTPGDSLTAIDWNWGDGTTQSGCAYFPESHTYAASGTYTVRVTALGTNHFRLQRTETITIPGSSVPRPSGTKSPTIKRIDWVFTPHGHQRITITGMGFGVHAAYRGDGNHLRLYDITRGWDAGWFHCLNSCPDWVSVNVQSWTNTRIVVSNLSGSYGDYGWLFEPGDKVAIYVSNASTSLPPLGYGNLARMQGAAQYFVTVPSYSPNQPLGTNSLTFVQSSLPAGTVGKSYWAVLNVTGGTAPYAWTVIKGKLPAGLKMNYGAITGTPAYSGHSDVTIAVRDNVGTTTQKQFLIAISSSGDLSASKLPLHEIVPRCQNSSAAQDLTVTNACANAAAPTVAAPRIWHVLHPPIPTAAAGCPQAGQSLDETNTESTTTGIGRCQFMEGLSDYTCHVTLYKYRNQGLAYSWQEYTNAETEHAVGSMLVSVPIEIGIAATGVGLVPDVVIRFVEFWHTMSSISSAGEALKALYAKNPGPFSRTSYVGICYSVSPPQGWPAFLLIPPILGHL